MAAYFLKRMLFLVPTILVISLISFGLSTMISGDPVSLIMGEEIMSSNNNPDEYSLWLEEYKRTASQYHLDQPKFYFSILPAVYPDTLYHILPITQQKHAKQLIHEYGDWALVQQYMGQVASTHESLVAMPTKPANYTKINNLVNQLSRFVNKNKIENALQELATIKNEFPENFSKIDQLEQVFDQMKNNNKASLLCPKFIWHGSKNQYHHWASGLLKGDLGVSIVDRKKVSAKIMNALPKTLLLNFLALIVALFFGFIFGVYLSTHQKSWGTKILLSNIYMVLAIPSFWLASLLVIFWTTSDYGAWTNIFPSGGFGEFPEGASIFKKIYIRLSHHALPVLSIAVPLIGVIALQLRQSLITELKKTYIKTARLKGISSRSVIWRHGVRNAMFPILAMFGNLLPAMIGGSVVIELIFNIPGMGHLLLHSIYSKDWAIVLGILMLTAVLTIVGLLFMDLLYVWANPKVRLKTIDNHG